MTDTDEAFMRRAIELARRGRGSVSPNPPVGCVLVRDGGIVGEGWHQRCGEAHAEVNAIAAAGQAARGSTAYVTLSPCNHTGRTGPCTQALLEAGVVRVLVAVRDPHPVAGDGLALLQQHGVTTASGLLAAEAALAMRGFLKHVATGLPFVTLKYALSLDGKTATFTGDSRWISCEACREDVQRLRGECDAVLIGIGTALQDNPRLNVRAPDRPQPRRVVIDSNARLDPDCRLLQESGGEVLVLVTESAPDDRVTTLQGRGATVIRLPAHGRRVAPREALVALAERGVREILCEGGAELSSALIETDLVDEIVAYVAPKLVGGRGAPGALGGSGIAQMQHARELRDLQVEAMGCCARLQAKLGDWSWLPA